MSDPGPPPPTPLRLHLRFRVDARAQGGGGGANARAARALASRFVTSATPAGTDLQVCSFDWNAPPDPARLFLDHGSFADASFWAYTVPKLRRGDTVIVTSEVCVQVAARLLRPGSVQILNVPLPVDLAAFRPVADRGAARRALERDLGIPARGPLLLVAAAFVRRKNHHLAVELLRLLRRDLPEARLAFAGSVPDRPESLRYREQVGALVEEAGLGDAVSFLGAQPADAVARLMAGADLLVHLSTCRLENFGLVAAEAAASGLPVLAADWGGLRDIVQHGETGWLAPTWLSNRGPRVDWRALAEPAARLLRDAEAWRAMSEAARIRAGRFGVEEHAVRLCAAAESAAGWARRAQAPVELTPEGQELAFRTIALNAMHPEIRDAGDEFRLLLASEAGRYYRLLAGPAATLEQSPPIPLDSCPAPLLRYEEREDGIEITDPAWPSSLALDPTGLELLRRCDGSRTLAGIVAVQAGSPEAADHLLAQVRLLTNEGILGPGVPLSR